MNQRSVLFGAGERMLGEWGLSRYQTDPAAFISEQLGEHAWSAQRQIVEAVRDQRHTAVQSCHEAGKALAVGTPLPTPAGWTSMGQVQPGDLLYDEQGQPTRVRAVSPIEQRPCFRVRFDDGSSIDAADDHLWQVQPLVRRPRHIGDWRDRWDATITVDTASLSPSLQGRQARWRIPCCRPLRGEQPWPYRCPPYTMGAWLGDGTTTRAEITCAAADADWWATQLDGTVRAGRGDTTRIVRFGRESVDSPARQLEGHKQMTMAMLRAPFEDRLALLRGIMDTDGFCCRGRAVGIDQKAGTLAGGIEALCLTLGWRVRRREGAATCNGVPAGRRERLTFTPDLCPFTLPSKADRWQAAPTRTSGPSLRSITAVEPLPAQPVRCVVVDSPSHLYLAGEGLIPTHNSWIAARTVAWWLSAWPAGEAFAVTTAPTFSQVRAILWREIGRAHRKGGLPGRLNQTEWWIGPEIVGFGRRPRDTVEELGSAALQGIHALRVLVVVDEAAGVPPNLWDAVEGLVANPDSRVLAIGHPDDPSSPFAARCASWGSIRIPYTVTPNFTGEHVPAVVSKGLLSPVWVEEREREWGEGSPLWTSRVLAEFPGQVSDGLISLASAQAACDRELDAAEPTIVACDVARFGADRTVIGLRQGPRFRWLGVWPQTAITEVTGRIIQALREHEGAVAHVDEVGVGAGVVDSLREQGFPVVGLNAGQGAADGARFVNARAEWWWQLRLLLQDGGLDLPDDPELVSELTAMRYQVDSKGRIKVESKETMKARGLRSPDKADTVMLAYASSTRMLTGPLGV